jgi:hypothetical protein
MNNNEWPPQEDKVEAFEDTRELQPDATKQQRINDILENANETNYNKITISEADKIARIQQELEIEPQIQEALAKRIPGDEVWKIPKTETVPSNKFRNLAMATKIALAGLFGLASTKSEANSGPLNDSSKNKIEVAYNGNETVNDELRQDWNEYLDWLKSKEMSGKEELNHIGYQLFDSYVKTHETSLTRAKLDDIRIEFLKLRAHIIKDVKEGKATYSGTDIEHTLLKGVLENEGTTHKSFPGQYFTSYRFPRSTTAHLRTTEIDYNKVANESVKNIDAKIINPIKENIVLEKTTDNGFVKINKNNTDLSGNSIAKQ